MTRRSERSVQMRISRRTQIEESLRRRGLVAKRILNEKLNFVSGLTRLKTYMLQKEPTADSLPYLIVPCSEELMSLFSFTVSCLSKSEPGKNPSCPICFSRNECLRKVILRLEKAGLRALQGAPGWRDKRVTIDDLLDDSNEYLQQVLESNMNLYDYEALKQLRVVVLGLSRRQHEE